MGESPFHVVVNVQSGTVVAVDDGLGEGCTPERSGGGSVEWDSSFSHATVRLTVVNRARVAVSGLAGYVRFVGDDDGVPMHPPRIDSTRTYVTPGGWRAVPVTPATLAPDEEGTLEIHLRLPAAEYGVGLGWDTILATGGYRVEIAGAVAAVPTAAEGTTPPPYLLVEAEDLHPGPVGSPGAYMGWTWGLGPGPSGVGNLDTTGLAAAPLCASVRPPAPGTYRVWARTGGDAFVSAGASGEVDVSLAGVSLGRAGSSGPVPFGWIDLGEAALDAAPTELCVSDGGGGASRLDALVIARDAPDAGAAAALLLAHHQLLDPAETDAAALEAVAARFAPQDLLAPPATLAEWTLAREDYRAALWAGLALDFPHADPGLPPETLDTLDRGDHVIEKIRFYAVDGLPVTGLVYTPGPQAPPGPWPLVLSPIGHWGEGKAYDPEQRRNVTLARLGYVVLTMDPLDQGERLDAGNDHWGGMAHYLVGDAFGSTMVLEWKRALGWMLERDDVDPSRVAVCGASGGGTLSLFLGALDDRIVAVAPAVAVGTWENLAVDKSGGDPEQYPFETGLLAPQWAILALSAPKPTLVISAASDSAFPADNATLVVEEATPVWDLYGTSSSLSFAAFPGPHNFDLARRETFYAWLNGVFYGDPSPVTEGAVDVEPASALEVGLGPDPETARSLLAAAAAALPAIPVPATAGDAEALAATVRAATSALWGAPPGAAGAAPRVVAVGDAGPAGLGGAVRERLFVESEPAGAFDDGYGFEAELYLPAGWNAGGGARGPAVVYASDGGKESAVHVPALLARGLAVLAIDARLTGQMLATRYEKRLGRMSGLVGVVLGESVAAWRATDLYAAVGALAARADVDPARIAVLGAGLECAPVALAVAALDARVAAAAVDLAPASLRDTLAAEEDAPPGLVTQNLLREVDVAALAAAAAPKPVAFVRTRGRDGVPIAADDLDAALAPALGAYAALGAPGALALFAPAPPSPSAALADFLAAALTAP